MSLRNRFSTRWRSLYVCQSVFLGCFALTRLEAAEQYAKALKLGQRNYKDRVIRGKYPYPHLPIGSRLLFDLVIPYAILTGLGLAVNLVLDGVVPYRFCFLRLEYKDLYS